MEGRATSPISNTSGFSQAMSPTPLGSWQPQGESAGGSALHAELKDCVTLSLAELDVDRDM